MIPENGVHGVAALFSKAEAKTRACQELYLRATLRSVPLLNIRLARGTSPSSLRFIFSFLAAQHSFFRDYWHRYEASQAHSPHSGSGLPSIW
jgi:hypothetical protein